MTDQSKFVPWSSKNLPPFWDELRFQIDDRNLGVRSDQIRTRIEAYPVMIASQLLVALGLVWMMWDHVEQHHLGLWLILILASLLLDGLFYLEHRHATLTVESCRRWAKHCLTFAILLAGLWGSTTLLMFVPSDLSYQAVLISVILGLAAGGVTINPVYLPALFAWETLLLLPIALRSLWEGDRVHLILGGMLLLYFGTVLNDGYKLSRVFLQSLWRRCENDALLADLSREKVVSELARERAENANREKSRFLATASHDLRQPLQAMVLFSDALQQHRDAQTPALQRIASQIGNSVESLMEMFSVLLNISRLEAGVIQVQRLNFDLQIVLDKLFVELQPLAQDKGLQLEVANLPGGTVVYSDPHLIEQVLRNLLSNAIRYTAKGSVELTCDDGPKGWRVCVRDTGIGIAKEVQEKIFEEFYQADNSQRDRRHGLGLGLAIVRRVEALLDIRVALESRIGQGSSFCFELQRGDPALAVDFGTGTEWTPSLFGLCVLLLEDDVTIREITAELLRNWGCEVCDGGTLDALMLKATEMGRRPHVLVTDYRLPHGMTAIHVIESVHARWGEALPVVVVTGDTGPGVLQELQTCHATLLHKPLPASRLRAVIARLTREG